MPDEFKPLSSRTPSPPSGGNGMFRLTSVPSSSPPTSAGSPAAPPQIRRHAPSPPADGTQTQAPTVTLQKDGDRVTRIQVRCTCGETITIECVY